MLNISRVLKKEYYNKIDIINYKSCIESCMNIMRNAHKQSFDAYRKSPNTTRYFALQKQIRNEIEAFLTERDFWIRNNNIEVDIDLLGWYKVEYSIAIKVKITIPYLNEDFRYGFILQPKNFI